MFLVLVLFLAQFILLYVTVIFYFARWRERSIVICLSLCHGTMYTCTEFALTITSRRQMAGSPPNLHTMDSRSAYIQGVLKVKVTVKGHVIRALLCWQENRLFSQANDRIKASSLQSNISCISVTFARCKHHCGRSLLSTIALFHLLSGVY